MKTIIIAEAGVNHNGSLERAMEMVRCAARAGADYVKFQTFRADSLVSRDAAMADYQRRNTGSEQTQHAMLKALELSAGDFAALAAECRRCGIGFMSTPFDNESVDLLASIGQDYWKIPSGELTNLPLLRKIGSLHSRVILSTGMATMAEVEASLQALEQAGTPRRDVMLLHCTTAYPTPPEQVNLRAMETLARCGTGGVGYSDHTRGIAVAVGAAALGACVIEKHFTLDRTLPGPDHKASLEPDELAAMVRGVHEVQQALGNPGKQPAAAEQANIAVARKSIVAACDITAGQVLTPGNMTVRRPGTGLSPMLWDRLCGTAATRDYHAGEQLELP